MFMRKLWAIPLVALLVTACGGAAAPSAAASRAPIKLTVGFSEIYEGMLPMWYAAANGIFQKNGLDVDLQYTSSSTGVSALLADKIQIFQGGGSEVLSANAGGADIVLIGNLVPVYPYVFLSPAEIKTVADLKGKKVGASSAGSTSDIATRVGLGKLGIDPDKDVTIVYVGSSQNRTAALLNGSIQGGLDQPPSLYTLTAKGFHVLFDEASLKLPVVNNGINVKRSFMQSNKDAVQRYIDSIVMAIAALRKDKAGGIAVYKKQLKVSDEDALGKTYDFAMGIFPDLPYAKADQLADSVRVLGGKNAKVKEYDLSKMLDESFVKSAGDRGLNKP
jgi:ABC-type nitrate/sulfonate/bicarbonate transport system substrate-binding protein